MLESRLAEQHGCSEARLVASGTTGLYLALAAGGVRGRRVAVPNGVCLNVPLAVILSGNHPVFLDIEPRTFGIDSAQLDTAGDLAAVIAVHAYGAIGEIDRIASWCRDHGVFLIEDMAVAQGAMREGRPAGSWGDIVVMSFGRGKIIDAGDGGAVLTNDRAAMEEIARAEAALTFPTSDESARAGDLNARHTALYNEAYGRGLNRHAHEFRALAIAAGPALVCRTEGGFADALSGELSRLPENLERRAGQAKHLRLALADAEAAGLLFCPPAPEGSVTWRFNIMLGRNRDGILRELLAEGLRVSSWYPSVDLFLEDRAVSQVHTPVSDRTGDRILNIWVNDEIDAAYLDVMAARLKTLIGFAA